MVEIDYIIGKIKDIINDKWLYILLSLILFYFLTNSIINSVNLQKKTNELNNNILELKQELNNKDDYIKDTIDDMSKKIDNNKKDLENLINENEQLKNENKELSK